MKKFWAAFEKRACRLTFCHCLSLSLHLYSYGITDVPIIQQPTIIGDLLQTVVVTLFESQPLPRFLLSSYQTVKKERVDKKLSGKNKDSTSLLSTLETERRVVAKVVSKIRFYKSSGSQSFFDIKITKCFLSKVN